MLSIVVPLEEDYDEVKNEFLTSNSVTLDLEHSLVSLSKWESIFEKPFLSSADKSPEELMAYVQCMILSSEVSPDVLARLTRKNVDEINNYINAKMTATTFNDRNARVNREVITAELIYYWMIALNVPFECQFWHLNRLLTLIKVCNVKNGPQKKMGRGDLARQQQSLNEQRRASMRSRG